MRRCLIVAVAQILLACGTDTALDPSLMPTGLPCDVQNVLENQCQGCHGNPPANGAPMPLVTYENLTAFDPGGVMYAQACVARMSGTGAQMPPLPSVAPAAADISTFQQWIANGMPRGNCRPNPFAVPPTCTSGQTWGGGEESGSMDPGLACIQCHSRSREAPHFAIAGTVYPTGHEPDKCYGAPGGATIEVTDANGAIVNLPVNGAGNFYSRSAIAFPIHVAVVANGERRAMSSSPPSGDCNTCHTQDGANMAPGRIVLP